MHPKTHLLSYAKSREVAPLKNFISSIMWTAPEERSPGEGTGESTVG
jgi:hypothetical protein